MRSDQAAAVARLGEANLFDQCKRLCKYLDDFMMYWDIPAGEDLKILEDKIVF